MRPSRIFWLFIPCLLLAAGGIAWNHQQQQQHNEHAVQIIRTQNQLQRWSQQTRRLPCPTSDAASGLENCTLPLDKEHFHAALPWKTLGLPRRFGQDIEYRVPAIYTQPAIFDRISPNALCRSGLYPLQNAATEAAFQLYSPATEDTPATLLSETRRWHMLPHLKQASAPQLFFHISPSNELEWFTRCGAYAYPQRKQTLSPENHSTPNASVASTLDGSFLAYPTPHGAALWQRQVNRWKHVQNFAAPGEGIALRQILFAPDNRWLVQLGSDHRLTLHTRQPISDNEIFSAQALPADWQAIANAGQLHQLFISPNGQWLAAFYADGLRIFQRIRGSWVPTSTQFNGTNHSSHPVLRWHDGAQMSLWLQWNGEIRRIWLTPASHDKAPVAQSALPRLALAADDAAAQWLPAPDGDDQILRVTCGDTLNITRFSAIGARFLPVAQYSIAKDNGLECGRYAWETRGELLSISIEKQGISQVTLPIWSPIPHSAAQD